MSLLPQIVSEVPEETARIARAAFPKSNPYLRLADRLGVIYQDGDFSQLFPFTGQPALAPVRLALTTILQFAEGLSDRQAADAVRGRMDWKYLFGLELTDPGFDASVLCEFRDRLIAGGAEELLLTKLLALCQEMAWATFAYKIEADINGRHIDAEGAGAMAMEKIKGEWRIVMYSTSGKRRPAAPAQNKN